MQRARENSADRERAHCGERGPERSGEPVRRAAQRGADPRADEREEHAPARDVRTVQRDEAADGHARQERDRRGESSELSGRHRSRPRRRMSPSRAGSRPTR